MLLRRSHAVAVIAACLVLLLVSAAASALALHRRDAAADRRAREALHTATFRLSAVGVASTHRVAVVVDVSSSTGARLVAASVSGDGWQVSHGRAVGLARAVDCVTPAPSPEAAEAVVELHGQRRTVDLLADPTVLRVVRSTNREACGDVDAGRALVVKAGAARRSGDRLSLDLTLTNRSVHEIRLRRVVVDGTHLGTSRPLPLVLAPQATRRLHVVIVLAECLGTGQVTSNGYVDALDVELAVDGTGGPATARAASAHLQQLVEGLRRQRCG